MSILLGASADLWAGAQALGAQWAETHPIVLAYVNQCKLKDRIHGARFQTAPNPRVFTSEG